MISVNKYDYSNMEEKHKYIQDQLKQYKSANQTYFGAAFIEALTEADIIDSIILTEQVPITCDDQVKIKEFKNR